MEFEYGRGFKLVGNMDVINSGNNNIDGKGFLGHVANSVHPSNTFTKQNAKYDLQKKFSTGPNDRIINKRLFAAGDIGYFPLVACREIAAGEEIIVNYGLKYWPTMDEWMLQPNKKKTQTSIDRDSRKRRRDEEKTQV